MNKSSARVSKQSFPHELAELDLVAEKGAGDINAFSANNDDTLACVLVRVPASRFLAI